MSQQTRKELGAYLQKWRLQAGLTQADVAKHLGFQTSQFVSNWERGIATPPFDTIPSLVKLYGIPQEEFLVILTDLHQKSLESMRKNLIALFRAIR